MRIDLKRVFEIVGESEPFECEVALSHVKHMETDRSLSGAKVQGCVKNSAGVVSVDFTATATLNSLCDRCLDTVSLPLELTFHHDLVTSLNDEDNDDYLLLENAVLDVNELAESDIILELPSKILCRADCKGLCPVCGENLNRTSCGCSTKYVDPRFAVLETLLDED